MVFLDVQILLWRFQWIYQHQAFHHLGPWKPALLIFDGLILDSNSCWSIILHVLQMTYNIEFLQQTRFYAALFRMIIVVVQILCDKNDFVSIFSAIISSLLFQLEHLITFCETKFFGTCFPFYFKFFWHFVMPLRKSLYKLLNDSIIIRYMPV